MRRGVHVRRVSRAGSAFGGRDYTGGAALTLLERLQRNGMQRIAHMEDWPGLSRIPIATTDATPYVIRDII